MPIAGQPRITVATCNGAGAEVSDIAGRSRSRNARRTEHASSEIGGRLPHKNVRWLLVDDSTTARLDMLPRRNRGRVSDNGDKIITSSDLHPKNSKTVFRIVVGNSLDESVQGFGHGQEAATLSAVEVTPILFSLQATTPIDSDRLGPIQRQAPDDGRRGRGDDGLHARQSRQ